jgi:hypothetical protein
MSLPKALVPPTPGKPDLDLRALAGFNRSNAVLPLLGILVPCAKLVTDFAMLEKFGKAII